MKTLAWDFSAEPRSMALLEWRGDAEPVVCAEIALVGDRAAAVLETADRLLREAGWDRGDIEALAVGLGPGSYTGIRAGLAMAQGWHLARGVFVYGANSMDAMAGCAWDRGWRGKLRVVVDGQRRELYVAGYDLGPGGWEKVEPLRLESVESLQRDVDRGHWLWAGPEVSRWFPEGRVLEPSAGWVGRLALRAGPVPPEQLEPVYLRPVQFVKTGPVCGTLS
jgi:tRNA threonylcarbamoyl adenosine modification protein YeaZ